MKARRGRYQPAERQESPYRQRCQRQKEDLAREMNLTERSGSDEFFPSRMGLTWGFNKIDSPSATVARVLLGW